MIRTLFLAALVAAAPAFADPLATGAHHFQSDDLSLWYRVAGPAHGVPVVYLHGGPAEGSQGLAHTSGPLLERTMRMVYFDQRGAGHSDRPEDVSRYTMALIVADIERLRLQLGVPRIALLGHSYGSILALEYAARFPEHVSRMLLIGTVIDQRATTNLECRRLQAEDTEAYARAVAAADRPGDPECIPMEGVKGPARRAYFLRASGAKPGTLEALDASDALEKVTMGGPAHVTLADPEFHYRFERIAKLTMPVLVIAGGKDRLTDSAPIRPFVAALPHGRMITYADAGHFLYVDDAARFASDAASFLRD
jgi:proline iminopeptidase